MNFADCFTNELDFSLEYARTAKIFSTKTDASSPAAQYYAELAVSSPDLAETIASIHCTYRPRDGQAERA